MLFGWRTAVRTSVRAAVLLLLLAVWLPATAHAAGTAPAPALPATERAWLVAVHQAHVATIAGGWDARRHASRTDVRDLGRVLVGEHTDLDRTVAALGEKYGVELPFGMNDAQRDALYDLQTRDGEAYDPAWLRLQVAEHRKIVAAGDRIATAPGATPDVAEAARVSAEVAREHLARLDRAAGGLGIATPRAVSGGTGGQAAAAVAGRQAAAAGLALLGTALIGAAALRRRRSRAAG